MSPVDGVERAMLVRKGPLPPGETSAEIPVHFNPASLQYTISNTMESQGTGKDGKDEKQKYQYVSQSSGKLTFDLLFDTTHNGEDVRAQTRRIARLMEPQKRVPPDVSFEWGAYKFLGIVESYKETIDFFAATGVPLRSSISLTLAQRDTVFEPAGEKGTSSQDAREVSSTGGAAGVGAQGGDPRAARGIAAVNGQASLRFSSDASFVVGASVQLAPPVAFATGAIGGGIGIGGGISGGIGVSGGAGIGIGGGISGGFGVSGGIGAGIGGGVSGGVSFGAGGDSGGGAVFGSRASARVTASEGAFAGLRAPAPERRFDRLRIDLLQPRPESSSLGTDQDANFQLGGRASIQGSASLRADVTGSARIRFDED